MLEVEAYGRILKFDAEKREWSSDAPDAGTLLEWIEEGMRKHADDYLVRPDSIAVASAGDLGFKVLHREIEPDDGSGFDSDVVY
jgi:hypothetical protein